MQYISALVLFGSCTLDCRESKYFLRGPETLIERITTNIYGNSFTNLVIIYLLILLCPD